MLAGGGRASAHGTVRLSADDVLAINNLKAGCAYGSDALAGGRTRQGWRLSSSAATTLNVETVPPG